MKRLFIILLFSAYSFSLFSQNTSNNFYGKIVPIGSFSLMFGTVTYIDISPKLGYKISESTLCGPGLTYKYFKQKDYPSDNIWGGGFFLKQELTNLLFLYGEYEALNLSTFYDVLGLYPNKDRFWNHAYFVGGGI